MSELKKRILEDIKSSMKAGDKERLGTLRLISSAIKQREVDERIDVDDADILAILDKMVKQRRESIAQFDKANRDDLSRVEQLELAIIQEFLPTALTNEEILSLIDDAIKQIGAAGIKDMGKVMGIVKPKAQGRADMSFIGKNVKEKLNS